MTFNRYMPSPKKPNLTWRIRHPVKNVKGDRFVLVLHTRQHRTIECACTVDGLEKELEVRLSYITSDENFWWWPKFNIVIDGRTDTLLVLIRIFFVIVLSLTSLSFFTISLLGIIVPVVLKALGFATTLLFAFDLVSIFAGMLWRFFSLASLSFFSLASWDGECCLYCCCCCYFCPYCWQALDEKHTTKHKKQKLINRFWNEQALLTYCRLKRSHLGTSPYQPHPKESSQKQRAVNPHCTKAFSVKRLAGVFII